MKCDEILELISGHIDELNTQKQEMQLQEHLSQCAQCREILQSYTDCNEHMSQLVEPPEQLIFNIMEQIRGEKVVPLHRAKKKYKGVFGIGSAVAAVAAALLLVIGTGKAPSLTQDLPDAPMLVAQGQTAKEGTATASQREANQGSEQSVQSNKEMGLMGTTAPEGMPRLQGEQPPVIMELSVLEIVAENQDFILETITDLNEMEKTGEHEYQCNIKTALALMENYPDFPMEFIPLEESYNVDDPCLIRLVTP